MHDLLGSGVDHAPALSAPGAAPLTFSRLRALVDRVAADLNAHGVGRGDCVAILLPNGPEMAAAFVAITAAAVAAPLNLAHTASELAFSIKDLDAKLMVVAETSASPAIEVAESLGIPVARLVATPAGGAGSFTLAFPDGERRPASTGGIAAPADVALLLHTSGTTSRPKLVALTHANLTASARNIRDTLALTSRDRALNVMPLFHVHGLIAGVLAPLSAGGEVCCAPGFNALMFFAWMEKVRPTWYTAVPSIHQAILGRAGRSTEIIRANPLRFIRSSSAPMPPQVMTALEEVFAAPVIEAYGMTEASHQIASNPLPPAPRHPGSVGFPVGLEVAVVGDDGEPLPTGERGEVVIRGDNVMSAYRHNARANAEGFTPQGWFRTGDQGRLTREGHLVLTGRLKEIINRGGEKISPREIDEIIMDHPAVAQCLAFALPHVELGEDVAAAVTLREDAVVGEADLRAFASRRLAPFKVPSRIVFLDDLPLGATGKLQRIGLAELLGLAKARPAAE